MRTFLKAVCLVVSLGVVSPALAQWPARATPGVPKTADGKPDLSAPAPRTADGKPDLSGIWTNNRGATGQRGGGTAAKNVGNLNRGESVSGVAVLLLT